MPEAGANPVKKTIVEAGIKKIEALQTEAKDAAADFREKIQGVVDDIADRGGVTKRALRAHLRERSLMRSFEDVRDRLPEDDQNNLDMIKQKLGVLEDTPLGKAAVAAAEGDGKVSRPTFGQKGDAHIAEQVAERKGKSAADQPAGRA